MSTAAQVLFDELKKLLLSGANTTQEAICHELAARGFNINQSKVSRLLRKVRAIKSMNEKGEMVYSLPLDAVPPPIHMQVSDLVIDIVANESIIIVKTSPGSASLIARIIDNQKCQILGTIAGDDAIFVAPMSVGTLDQTMTLIRESLGCD